MTTQSEALRLARLIEAGQGDLRLAAEMRRLHALNVELTENLEKKSVAIQRIWKERDELRKMNGELLEALKYHQEQTRPIERTRAAIAKAEGKV